MEISQNNQLVITKYSHFIKITRMTPRAQQLTMKFCFRYIHKTFQQRPKNNNDKPKVYATRKNDNTEVRLHIGQLNEYLEFLSFNNLDSSQYTIVTQPIYNPVSVEYKLKDGWKLRDKQLEAGEYIVKNDINTKMLALPTGEGKAQPLNAKIKIPGGWTTMGELVVGDEIIAKDGMPAEVVGIYPQGKKKVYKVIFEDGRYTRCCLEHLWKTYTSNEYNRVMSVKEILQYFVITKRNCPIFIDLLDPEITEEKELVLDPYRLGSILGKVSLSKSSNVTEDIHPDYLNGSKEQRLSLVQGLLDTTSKISVNGAIVHITGAIKIAETLQYLIRSLGGIALVHKTIYNGNIVYKVNIKYKKALDLFRLESKHKVVNNSTYLKDLKLQIINIIEDGYEDTQCIAIDHPDHLYITDDFIATHNTVITLLSVSQIKTRTLIVVLPTFIEKWSGDIVNIFNIDPKEVMIVQGSSQLKGLVSLGLSGELTSKFIIISLTTLQIFFKQYEELEIDEQDYGINPEQLCAVLKAGNMIVDESHMHAHAVFKLMLYTHIPKIIALSATMISSDPFLRSIYQMMYPRELRYDKIVKEKYVKVVAINYSFYDIKKFKIRTTEYGSNNYSHNAFEKSIIRNSGTLSNYIKLVIDIIYKGYISDYKKGDKLIIFASSIAMCTILTEAIAKEYPSLSVKRYVEKDPYENIIDPDIRITTALSGGTGIDIPGLRVAIMTTSISSVVSNVQTLGRLRKLPDRDVTFYYIYSSDIPKQLEYHRNKKALFSTLVASHKEFITHIRV